MPDGEQGKVFWSARAGRFFQEGRAGALSFVEAASHLRLVERAGRARLIDERSRLVPDLPKIIPDRFDISFVDRTRSASLTIENVYKKRAPKNAHYTALAVYADEEGHIFLARRSFPAAKAIDQANEKTKIAAAINEQIPDPTKRRNTDQIWRFVKAVFHYLVR